MKICAKFINQMSVNSQYPSRKRTKRCATLILHFPCIILTVLCCSVCCSFVVGKNCRSTLLLLLRMYVVKRRRNSESEYVFTFYDVRYIKQNHVESINPLILSSLLIRIVDILYLVAQ